MVFLNIYLKKTAFYVKSFVYVLTRIVLFHIFVALKSMTMQVQMKNIKHESKAKRNI